MGAHYYHRAICTIGLERTKTLHLTPSPLRLNYSITDAGALHLATRFVAVRYVCRVAQFIGYNHRGIASRVFAQLGLMCLGECFPFVQPKDGRPLA